MPSRPSPHSILDALAERVHADPTAPRILVCRTRGAGREILRSLALEGPGWTGIEHATPASLAHDRVAVDLAREGLASVDEFDRRAIVDAAIDAALAGRDGPLADLADGVGFRDALANAIDALRLAGIGPERLGSAGLEDTGRRRVLVEILADVEERLRAGRLVDEADVFRRAIESVRSEGVDAEILLMPDLGARGLPGRFVGALLDAGGRMLPGERVLGIEPVGILAAPTHEPSRTPATRLGCLHAVAEAPRESAPGDRSAAEPNLDLFAAAEATAPEADLDLFAAAGPTDELREVLRRVISGGHRWDEVEIVSIDPVVYGSALDALATRLSIPVTYAVGLPIERTRQGRAATAYLGWIQEEFPADELRRLLETGDLRLGADAPASERLAARLRRLRVGWGRDRYRFAIDTALRRLEEMDEEPGDDDDRWSAQEAADRRARERSELEALETLLTPILEATPPVPGRAAGPPGRVSPAGLARGLCAFLAFVPAPTPVETTARDRLEERLERIAATLTRETTFRAALAILRSHLDIRVPSPGETGPLPWSSAGGALHLSDLDHGGWSGRPVTFVVGLDAGRFPGAGIQDPILLDADRRRLDPVALPGSNDRLRERRWTLAALVARLRGRVTLSYSGWTSTEGRAVAPAADLLQAFRLQRADPTLDYEAFHAAMTPIACPIPRGRGRLDVADVWLGELAEGGLLRSGVDAVRRIWPHLDRGLVARATREEDRATPHRGAIVPRPAELDPRAESDLVVSASTLETLAACPLRYFYQKVLRVRPPDDPERDPGVWLDPLQRGSLLHDVYERSLVRAREREIDLADPGFEELALAILEERIERYRTWVPVPGEYVFHHETEALAADVRSFVGMVAADPPAWLDVEKQFGYGRGAPPPVDVEVPGGTLHVSGRIDRIDELDDGGIAIVDYKTGSTYRYSARFGTWRRGRHLQHLVYARVAEALYDRRVARMEYHFPTVKGENQVVPYAVDRLKGGERVLDALGAIVATGHFLPTDDEDDCAFCDYRKVCRVTVDEWHDVDSPPAAWGKERIDTLDAYAGLRLLRELDE